MIKLHKQILIRMVIPTVAFCTFVPTDESNIEHFHTIKSCFN